MTRAGRFASWPSREAPVSAATLAREMAAVAQVLLAPPPFPEEAARGSGQPVIVIPGFLSPDMTHGAAARIPDAPGIPGSSLDLRPQYRADAARDRRGRASSARDRQRNRQAGLACRRQPRRHHRAGGGKNLHRPDCAGHHACEPHPSAGHRHRLRRWPRRLRSCGTWKSWMPCAPSPSRRPCP